MSISCFLGSEKSRSFQRARFPFFEGFVIVSNEFGEFAIVVQASRLPSLYRQAGRLYHNGQRDFFAVPNPA